MRKHWKWVFWCFVFMEILLNTDTPTAKARWSVSKINKVYGLSNNSALNMLISKYVQEKKKILSDEDL